VIQSVTVSRGGHRWYASVLVREQLTVPGRPTRVQAAAGTVGVDVGVHHLAALSTGELIPNPRTKATHARTLASAGRAYARTQPGSRRRERVRRRLVRLQHLEAARRAGVLHGLTKRLATGWAVVAVEDLNVAGMTRSARGTAEAPGRNVRAKSGLNRAVLDVAPGGLRRQLGYKTRWYGSRLAVLDRWWPSSKTCSARGTVKPKLCLGERTFHCEACGHTADRDTNAAVNIARHAVLVLPAPVPGAVAPSTEETRNARRADVRPIRPRPATQTAMKREDPPAGGPPHGSDAAAVLTSA
jgi:putative transposase